MMFLLQETYLDAIHSAKHPTDLSKGQQPTTKPLTPLLTDSSSQIAIGGCPDPTIKLDAFISATSDAIIAANTSLSDQIKNDSELDEISIDRCTLLFSIIRDLLAMTSNLFIRCGFTSAQLLLPLVTSDPINSELFGTPSTAQVQCFVLLRFIRFGFQTEVEAEELYGDLDTEKQKSATDVNGVNSQTASATQSNLRQTFLKDLLTSFKELKTVSSSAPSFTLDRFKSLLRVVTPRINDLVKLRKFVATSVVLDPPPLVSRLAILIAISFLVQILRSSYLMEPDLLQKSELFKPHRLPPESVALPLPFSPGLPCRFPTSLVFGKARLQGASAALSILQLAREMVRYSIAAVASS